MSTDILNTVVDGKEKSSHFSCGPAHHAQVSFPGLFRAQGVLRVRYQCVGRSNLYGPHYHQCLEVGYVHKGRGALMIGDKRFSFSAGDFSIINGPEPHIAYFASECVCSWMYFDVARLLAHIPMNASMLQAEAFAGPDFLNHFAGGDYPALSQVIGGMLAEFEKEKPFLEEAILSSLLALLVNLHRLRAAGDAHFAKGKKTPGPGAQPIERIGPAIDFMHAHFADNINNDALSKTVNMSRTNFRREFRRLIGLSPYEYLTLYRLSMARSKLLDRKMKVEAIAVECGFEDPSAFRRAFRKRMGLSPAAWRMNPPDLQTE